jgi:YHS domain-containing protein
MKRITVIGVAALVIGCMFIAQVYAADLQVRKPAPDEVGRMVACTVMNVKFEVGKETPVIDYKGRRYYFCCQHCVKDFKKNPDKYAK